MDQFALQDVGVLADCERTVQVSIDGLGGLDIIISNAVSVTASGPPGINPVGGFGSVTVIGRDGRNSPPSVILTLFQKQSGIRYTPNLSYIHQ